jgi:glycosyltransferase involved in cell wall biosynthesis
VHAHENTVAARSDRPRVVILRGQLVNPWELRPWEQLTERFDVSVAVPRRHLHPLGSLHLERVRVSALSDFVPTSWGSALAARLPFNRHLRLEAVLAGATIVHIAELHPWFSAQAASLRDQLGYRLLTTVWETIPFKDALRHRLTRTNRSLVMEATDLFLATTERARHALELEGVPGTRIRVVQPGIDLDRFAQARAVHANGADPLVISPGRLVWEKGHQDVLRAVAALRAGIVDGPPAAARLRVLILGSGPEEHRLRAYAEDLGLSEAVSFRGAVPYDEMARVYASASAMVLASLPTRSWEEQFGMVLVEAMAAELPIITTTCGAIPEVVAPEVVMVPPGDWLGIARALANGALRAVGEPVAYTREVVERLGVHAAAERLAATYESVLAGAPAAA